MVWPQGALSALTPGCTAPSAVGEACPLTCHSEVPTPFLSAIPLTAYGPMAAAAAAAAVVRGTGKAFWGTGSKRRDVGGREV